MRCLGLNCQAGWVGLDWIGLGWVDRVVGAKPTKDILARGGKHDKGSTVDRSVGRSEVVQRLLFSVSLFVSFKHKFPAATAIQRLDSCVRCGVGLG